MNEEYRNYMCDALIEMTNSLRQYYSEGVSYSEFYKGLGIDKEAMLPTGRNLLRFIHECLQDNYDENYIREHYTGKWIADVFAGNGTSTEEGLHIMRSMFGANSLNSVWGQSNPSLDELSIMLLNPLMDIDFGAFYEYCREVRLSNSVFMIEGMDISNSYDFVGKLHNEILDAYLVALEENPELDVIGFMCNYGNGVNRDKYEWFVNKMVEEISQYSSFDELFTGLENKGIYSSNCMDVMRNILSFAMEQPDVSYIREFRCQTFEQQTFEDHETDLIVGSLSILEYSTIYWADENKVQRWEIFRVDINEETLVGSCYNDFREGLRQLSLQSSSLPWFAEMNDLIGGMAAVVSIDCINKEFAEFPDLQIVGKKQRASFIAMSSAEASGRMK